jgi:hypothetical protein
MPIADAALGMTCRTPKSPVAAATRTPPVASFAKQKSVIDNFARSAFGVRRCSAAFYQKSLPGNHVVGIVEVGCSAVVGCQSILSGRPSDRADPKSSRSRSRIRGVRI